MQKPIQKTNISLYLTDTLRLAHVTNTTEAYGIVVPFAADTNYVSELY